MRVLYVSALGGSGMGRATQRFFPLEAAKRGVDVAMVGEIVADELAGKVETYPLGEEWRHLRLRLAGLRRVVRTVRPDIVHVFRHIDCELYPLVCGARTKAMWLVDGRTPILATGLLQLPSLLSGRACAQTYDSLAAPAAAVGRAVFGRRRVEFLPLGYDDQTFFASPSHAEARDRTVLRLVYTGSLEARRRMIGTLSALVEAAMALPTESRRRFTIDVYGGGAEDEAIRGLAASAPETIRHAGLVPQDELAARLRDYDIGLSLILNRVYREAPPLKTIEYLASGLPVIASDTPGNRHYVREGVNGWLVDHRPESVCRLVLRLCQDGIPEGMAARATQSAHGHAWGDIVDQRLLPLYRSLLEARAPGAGR